MRLRYWRFRLRVAGLVYHFGPTGRVREFAARIHPAYTRTYREASDDRA